MDKIGRPRGLIAYDTVARKEAKAAGRHESLQLFRPRTLLYAALLVAVGLVMLGGWLKRTILEVNVLADRSPPYVLLTDGSIRNGFTVKILNKLHEPRTFTIAARGLAGASLSIVGFQARGADTVSVATDSLAEFRVLVSVPKAELAKLTAPSNAFELTVTDVASNQQSQRQVTFRKPPASAGQAP